MDKFQAKDNRIKRILKSVPFLLILFIILIFLSLGVFDLFKKMQDTNKNKNLSLDKLNELEGRKEVLLKDIEDIKTEEGKEKIYRENYGLGKEGEGLIVIVEEEKTGIVEEKKETFFGKIINWFK